MLKKIKFEGFNGDTLAASLETPENGEPAAYALLAHCFTCGNNLRASRYMSEGLVRKGYGVLRFDFTGIGSSEGDFSNTNFTSNTEDIVKAADYMRRELRAPSILAGHSLGGTAVLAAAKNIPEAQAVATIGAPIDPEHVCRLFSEDLETIRTQGEAEVTLEGRSFRIKKQFLQDVENTVVENTIGSMNKALLIFHSAADKTVHIDNARKIYEAAMHPKSFISLDEADHLLSNKEDALYVSEVLAAWASRYMQVNVNENGATSGSGNTAYEDGVSVVETGESLFTQSIMTGIHIMAADEPLKMGGMDKGPSPYEYLLAALGACTSMTLRLYARRKGISLKRVKVFLRHGKVHAEDCADCETKHGMIDLIDREIVLEGELSDEQRRRMMQIADRCPVHRTLTSEVKVKSKLI